jgi:hypothetical protein
MGAENLVIIMDDPIEAEHTGGERSMEAFQGGDDSTGKKQLKEKLVLRIWLNKYHEKMSNPFVLQRLSFYHKPGDSSSGRFSGRARVFRIIGSILVFLVACLGVTLGITTSNSKRPVHETERGVCKDLELAELKGAHLEVTMGGLSRLATEEEMKAMENAVLDAYNDVSARCGDVYERWMYEANMVSQTIQDTDDGGSVMVAEIEMTISCFDCPDEEVLASEYTGSARSQLLPSSTLSRIYDLVRGSSASSRFLQESTINAADVVYKISDNLQRASQNNLIESTYSRLTKTFIENRKSRVKQNVPKIGKAYRASLFQKHKEKTALKEVRERSSKRFPYAASILFLSRSSTFVEADGLPQLRLKGKKDEKVRCSYVFSI